MDTLEREQITARLADLAAVAPDVQLVVLFGSHVRGRARKGSDVDVAVRCDALADLDALFLLLAPRVGSDRLDLVDVRRAGTLLAFEVARSGQLVYERRPGAFREFQSLASRRYCDTASHPALPRARAAPVTPADAAIVRRKLAHIITVLAALDVNAHLIAEVGSEVPDDYYGGFIKLADLGIVEPELARDLAPSAGLRNRLVHEYDAIDDARVLEAIGTIRRQYPRYVHAIERFLAQAGH